MTLFSIIDEIVDIRIDQALEKFHISEGGIICGTDPRPGRLTELAIELDRWVEDNCKKDNI